MLLILGLTAVLGLGAGCSREVPEDTGGHTDQTEEGNKMEEALKDVKVDVGEYKGLEVEVTKIPDVTDEEVEMQMESLIKSTAAEMIVADRAVAEGDLVSIDYQSYENEQPVGEAESNYYLTIGSGVFFDGADKKLAGMKGGDTVEIPVTLPEAYPDETMAGKSIVLKVTVNGIVTQGEAELTDAYVASISDCKTVAEYKAQLKAQLQESIEYQRQMAKRDGVWKKMLEQVEISDYPERIRTEKTEKYKKFDEEGAALESMSLEDYVDSYFGMTMDEYEKQIRDTVTEEIKTEMIVRAIAEKEGFLEDAVSDDELAAYAREQGYEDVAAFKQEMAQNGLDMDTLKQSILLEKVTDILIENAKVTEVEGPVGE